MSDAAARIWAYPDYSDWSETGGWVDHPEGNPDAPEVVEYIRADLAALDKHDVLIGELLGALEFYGDETAYDTQYDRLPCDCCTDIYEPINDDRGAKARAAITRANEAGYGAQEQNRSES